MKKEKFSKLCQVPWVVAGSRRARRWAGPAGPLAETCKYRSLVDTLLVSAQSMVCYMSAGRVPHREAGDSSQDDKSEEGGGGVEWKQSQNVNNSDVWRCRWKHFLVKISVLESRRKPCWVPLWEGGGAWGAYLSLPSRLGCAFCASWLAFRIFCLLLVFSSRCLMEDFMERSWKSCCRWSTSRLSASRCCSWDVERNTR